MIDCIDKIALVIEGLDYIAAFSRMRGNKILERLTVQDSNTPHSCDYRYNSFCEDIKSFYAIMSLVSILGEAATQVMKVNMDLPDDIPWKNIRGIRNRIIHQYFDVDGQILWQVASIEIPKLKKTLEVFIKRVKEGNKEI